MEVRCNMLQMRTPITPAPCFTTNASIITRTYNPIQMRLITTSKPLLSPPSYLKLHMPSVFSFQYAPVALCIPRRPTCGFPSVPVVSGLVSLVVTAASLVSVEVPVEAVGARALLRADEGTRCWMIVLLTANL
jgi:hypothetical protein